jgi:hypothetical protein
MQCLRVTTRTTCGAPSSTSETEAPLHRAVERQVRQRQQRHALVMRHVRTIALFSPRGNRDRV